MLVTFLPLFKPIAIPKYKDTGCLQLVTCEIGIHIHVYMCRREVTYNVRLCIASFVIIFHGNSYNGATTKMFHLKAFSQYYSFCKMDLIFKHNIFLDRSEEISLCMHIKQYFSSGYFHWSLITQNYIIFLSLFPFKFSMHSCSSRIWGKPLYKFENRHKPFSSLFMSHIPVLTAISYCVCCLSCFFDTCKSVLYCSTS